MPEKKYPEQMLRQLRESSKPKTSAIPNQGLVESDERLKYKLMELDNKNVVMSNVIVLGSQPTSLIEAKLLRILLSQTKSLQYREIGELMQNPPVFYIEVRELSKMFYANDTSNIYRDIQSAAVSLTKRNIFFKTRESDEWISYPWTSYVKYGNGVLQVKINPDLYPYLINMKGNFSKFSLDVLLSFKSKYSMRLYEGLQAKIYQDHITREHYKEGHVVEVSFDIDELRVITSTVLIYGKLYNLKKRCIDPAVAEISEKTTMKILGYAVGERAGVDKNTILFSIQNKEKHAIIDEEAKPYAPLKVYRLDDSASLNSCYIDEEAFHNYDVQMKESAGEIREVLTLYGDKAEDFNPDFQEIVETGAGKTAPMKKMVERKRKGIGDEQIRMSFGDALDISENVKAALQNGGVLAEQAAVSDLREIPTSEYAEFEEVPAQSMPVVPEGFFSDTALNLMYVTRIFNAAEWRFSLEEIEKILKLYGTDSLRFNRDFKKSQTMAAHNPVGYMIKIAENAKNQKKPMHAKYASGPAEDRAWLNAAFEKVFQEIVDYWDGTCLKMQMEVPEDEGIGQGSLKPIRRTDIRHKRYVHQLFEEGETLDSILEAIDVAATSAYFIRVQGSFNFFINPKNYFAIAAGEWDYDAQQARLWQMGRGIDG